MFLRSFFVFIVCVATMMPVAGAAGVMIEVGGIKAILCAEDDRDRPTALQEDNIITAAKKYQAGGKFYVADAYHLERLKKGTKIYALVPGQSVFYTDFATVKSAVDPVSLNQALQVAPHALNGYRQGVAAYVLACDMWVAAGECKNNTKFGIGGGKQYVVPVTLMQREIYVYQSAAVKEWNEIARLPNAA